MKNTWLLFPALLMASCFPQDEPVMPYPGNVTTIGYDIRGYQSYFDLGSNAIVRVNAIEDWDLGFECGTHGWRVRVNSGNGLLICRTDHTDIEEDIFLTGNETWMYDAASGNGDSTAIGAWGDTAVFPVISVNTVYLAGRKAESGYSVAARIQMIRAGSSSYTFNYALTGKNTVYEASAVKNDSVYYVYYNLEEEAQKNLEPEKTRYDLIFMPYYDLAYYNGIHLPYLVGGVLLNRNGVTAGLEKEIAFNDFTLSDTAGLSFSDEQDAIGYNWKDVSVDIAGGSATYYIKPGLVYIIRSAEGDCYKLRFLSFTLNGIDGFPQFEYKYLVPAAE